MENELFKSVAIFSAREAGKMVMDNFQKIKEISFKAKSDIVTDIDVKAEKIILDAIKSNFPDHDILSEEIGLSENNVGKYLWVIDPIDGTINYYHGIEPFRIAICLLENKIPILNVLYDPVKDDLYVAQKGGGAFLNDKKITVNDNADLKNSLVMFHLSSKQEPRAKMIGVLEGVFNASMHMRMVGSGLASMSYIAGGKVDVYFNFIKKPWDILPGALLIEEAGGKVTDIKGEPVTFESTSVIASNGKVHDQILKLLEGV